MSGGPHWIARIASLHDIYGIDSWQALTNAQQLLRLLLNFFVEAGGKLFWEKDGEEIAVDDLFLTSKSDLTDEQPEPIGSLTDEQQARVDQLTAEELQQIDDALMSEASNQFRKVARIVGFGMMTDELSFEGIPDIFYASRVKKLVEEGRLISQGNLDYIRFSEVRLPD